MTRSTVWLTLAIVGVVVCTLHLLEGIADAAKLSSCQVAERVFAPERIPGEPCRVLQCESTGDPWAVNGQYLGLFQLGSWARGRYLHGPWYSPWENAKGALRLYRANHHSWQGQWTCAPAAR